MEKFRDYLKESSEIYNMLRKDYPKATKLVQTVSQAVDFDIEGAMAFCLHLLEDVNAHSEMKEVEKLFIKQMKNV